MKSFFADSRQEAATRDLEIDGDGAYKSGMPEHHTLYHGTSWEVAQIIKRDGFKASEGGCLGAGTYVARAGRHLQSCIELVS
jgi:hypothetical protein